MNVVITGSTGFLGSALSRSLVERGARVTRLVRRRTAGAGEVRWDPATGEVDTAGLAGCDVVVHLAGEPIAGVWTAAKKRRIRESRVRGTSLLARALASLDPPPRALLCASGAHYYGAREDDSPVDETSPPGSGFLAGVVREWEAAAGPAREAGIRVVYMRNGIVLGRGGMLAAMLPAFRLGLGGRVGSGAAVMSWIALPDVVAAVHFLIERADLDGPFNFTAPGAVDSATFARTLAGVLSRPAPFVIPSFVARLLPGGMGEELLLMGARVVPRRLLEAGFRFRYPDLEPALRSVLGR